jgi:hypothetical protein
MDERLFAPAAVVRQAKTSGEVGGCPFRRGSHFILELGSARKSAANRDLVLRPDEIARKLSIDHPQTPAMMHPLNTLPKLRIPCPTN